MLANRVLAAVAVGAVAIGGVATPAHAATLGPRDYSGYCAVDFTFAEKQYIRDLEEQRKALGLYEQARDQVKAIETVFPEAQPVGQRMFAGTDFSKAPATPTLELAISEQDREALDKLGMPKSLISAYMNGYFSMATSKPVKPGAGGGREIRGTRVAGEKNHPVADLGYKAGFPVADVDPALKEKLDAAYLTTPTGNFDARDVAVRNAERLAMIACGNGAPKEIEYPKVDKLAGSSKNVDGETNIPAVVGAVIAVILALLGVAAALQELGFMLPF